MIKTRLVGLLSHAKKYIVYTILWQWAALLSQVIAVFTVADLLERRSQRIVFPWFGFVATARKQQQQNNRQCNIQLHHI